MKFTITFIFAVILGINVIAQSPGRISYQAVIRNSSNQLVNNHAVGMRISILQGSPSGTVVYTETKSAQTNANGLVTLEIGGEPDFGSINWANGTYYLKTETDPTGGSNYTITGVSQILSVPYALHANTAGKLSDTGIAFWKLNGENTNWTPGNVGIGTLTPTAKLSIQGTGLDFGFGKSAFYVADQNRFFDFNAGLVFRGTGHIWAARFTSTANMNDDGEIVGIYKKEITEGKTREDIPEQKPVAVFKNNGVVALGTNNNIWPGLTIRNTLTPGVGYGALTFQADLANNLNYAGIQLNENNDLTFKSWNGAWYESLVIKQSSGNIGISTNTPGAKLTIDNIGSDFTFGKGALYIADENHYFDFDRGLIFRGTGNRWSARFTANNQMDLDGEIVGIYKIENSAGATRIADPAQGVIAVFRNNGRVGIGTSNPQATLHVNAVLKLEPQGTPPQGNQGDLYAGTNGKLYFHNGSGWKEIQLAP